ncbi:uncharacterized protein LOC125038699 [Penaeus chinensis]|uniref:uncharacterized protein LOC125038699 n=1 Tax=Penaeus chinensis TaxID=139456 RepID=UPI001FB8353B|nr:uncharacterized protein LOC125038699 [Penaeus chinensis]
MELDRYLMWLVDSLKASLDDDTVNQTKLNKNIESCFQRVKKACAAANKDKDFEDFRCKSTLLLLLCCPSVKNQPIVRSSKDLQLVISAVPTLKESHFLSVVKNQRCYRCLIYILSFLPTSYLSTLIEEYFASTDGVNPVTLAMSLELFTSYLLSWQSNSFQENCESNILKCLDMFVKFLSSKTVSSDSKVQIKSSAYFFMYLTKYLLLMLNVYIGKEMEYPEIPESLICWRDMWRREEKENRSRLKNNLFTKDLVITFLKLCQQKNEAINIGMWMDWSEINLPVSVIPHKGSTVHSNKTAEKSIQSVICNIAFDIMQIFDLHPNLHESCQTSKCQDFLQFMKQVACDPNYDPDYDLGLEQLLQEIDLRDEREQKLLEILLDKEEIYSSQKCLDSVKNHPGKVSSKTRKEVLVKYIDYVKSGNAVIAEWQEFILELAEDIPSEDLMPIIVEKLDSGQNEILKTSNFNLQSTAVFNQLVGENAPEMQEKHVWLCLQSGKEVVQQAVTLPISLPGLVPVMVRALSAIPEVCQATSQSGISVLASALQQIQAAGLSGREKQDFANLVKGLMNTATLPVGESLHILIEPYLGVQSEETLENVALPLELLKNIIDNHPSTIIQPGIKLDSLIISLMCVMSNTAQLLGPQANTALALRLDAEHIISTIAKALIKDMPLFEKDISIIKQVTRNMQLHPRSFLPLVNLLECEICQESIVDRVLYKLYHMELKTAKENLHGVDSSDFDLDVSQPQWILVLVQLLPHGSENEWISGMFLTHQFLQSGQTAYPTLRVMRQLLHLMCIKCVGSSLNQENEEDCDVSSPPSLSIQHCFKSFSASAMVYIQELLRIQPYNKRFNHLCNIFKWWSQGIPSFQCHPELPTLFLAKLCNSIEEMVKSGKLKIEPDEVGNDGLQNGCMWKSFNDSEEKSVPVEKAQPSSQPSVADAVQSEVNASSEEKGMANKENLQKEELARNTVSKTKNDISRASFHVEIDQLIFCLVAYVPTSNIAATVGSKLKNLDEL